MTIKSIICKAPECFNPRDKKQRSTLCVMHRVRWSRHKSFNLPVKPPLPIGVTMICKHHGELSEEKCYFNEEYGYPQCLECKRITMKIFKDKNPNRDTNILNKNYTLRKDKVQFSKKEYHEMLTRQNNVCFICKKEETSKSNGKKSDAIRRLSIDHCHSTKKIRGLLCSFCNKGLGHFKDSIELLESAIKYLKSHS